MSGKFDEVTDSVLAPVAKMKPTVTAKADPTENGRIDVLMLRMLVDYMAGGLVGPFQVIKDEPTFRQKMFGSKGVTYRITGPDFQNRLRIEFFEQSIAKDICHALNRAYGFEDLEHWSSTVLEQFKD